MARHEICATRRAVIAGLAGTLARGPVLAQAASETARCLGVLMLTAADAPQGQADAAALVQGLDALNWREGGNLRIDWRWAGSDRALIERYAMELVTSGPDVIFALATPSVEALRRQTSTIPIVFVNVIDPVGQGFVENLAHPGGNVTGFSNYGSPMAGKWLQMLTQITPPVARVAVLFNPATLPVARLMMPAIEAPASAVSVSVHSAPVNDVAEIETTLRALAGEERGGFLVLPHAFALVHRDAIVALAAKYRVATVYPFGYFARAGGLMSYGIEQTDPFRRAAAYIDRILKGDKPGELPVQAPTKFELVINLKAAQALGVTVDPALLATADEVIE